MVWCDLPVLDLCSEMVELNRTPFRPIRRAFRCAFFVSVCLCMCVCVYVCVCVCVCVCAWCVCVCAVPDGALSSRPPSDPRTRDEYQQPADDLSLLFDAACLRLPDKFFLGDVLDLLLLHWKAFKAWKLAHARRPLSPSPASAYAYASGGGSQLLDGHAGGGVRRVLPGVLHRRADLSTSPPPPPKPEGLDVGNLVLRARKLTVALEDDAEDTEEAIQRW